MPPRKNKDNITYKLKEVPQIEEVNIDDIMKNFDSITCEDIKGEQTQDEEFLSAPITFSIDTDYYFAQVKEYDLNNTTKQLIMINDYYKLGNTIKLKKMDIIERIVCFENDEENAEIVGRRQTLWFYLHELKNDPLTKKYVLSV